MKKFLFFILMSVVCANAYSVQSNYNHSAISKQSRESVKEKMEYTLSIIKPDATQRNLVKEINKMLTSNGLKIVAQKEIRLTKQMAENFYIEHKDKSFYKDLIKYMTSGPVIVQVLAGKDAILKNRNIMGTTNPKNAQEGTIRKKYGISISHNSIHGSDSPKSAKREISLFFDYSKVTDKS